MQASQSIRNCGYRQATCQVTALTMASHQVSRGGTATDGFLKTA